MFEVGDEIYKRKYFGNELKTDKSTSYIIVGIMPHVMSSRSQVAYLDNNKSFIIEEDGIIYAEKSTGLIRICCCAMC